MSAAKADNVPFTVIIPAFNEERVIARCLDAILSGAPVDGRFQIIVAANGSRDATVAVARAAAPDATILDLIEGSKTNAMNEARKLAAYQTQIFLDADVECDFPSLQALANVVGRGHAMAAIPQACYRLDGSDILVRAYYRTWLRRPYAHAALGGAGCYALSGAALARIGPFPSIIADDFWAMSRFARSERCLVAKDENGEPVRSIVKAPARFIDQIRIDSRRQVGSRQLRRLFPSRALSEQISVPAAKSSPSLAAIFDFAVFATLKLASRAYSQWQKFKGNDLVWLRDTSARA